MRVCESQRPLYGIYHTGVFVRSYVRLQTLGTRANSSDWAKNSHCAIRNRSNAVIAATRGETDCVATRQSSRYRAIRWVTARIDPDGGLRRKLRSALVIEPAVECPREATWIQRNRVATARVRGEVIPPSLVSPEHREPTTNIVNINQKPDKWAHIRSNTSNKSADHR